MFGYLQVQKSELLVREYESYKAVYCGLCKQLGKDYSFLSRFALSYDCTFYALLLMSLKRSCTGFKNGRCRFNPLKKCSYAITKEDAYGKAAALTVILAYYKLKDDILDGSFLKRLRSRLLLPLFHHWQKKAAKRYSYLEKAAAKMMAAQNGVEKTDSPGIDLCCDPTASMLSDVLSYEGEDEMQSRVLSELGYQLGRWIYLMDAADDYENDKKRGSFNPFLYVDTDNLTEYQSAALSQSLARAYDAYNLLSLIDFKGILDNMLLYGFPSKQNEIVRREEKNDQSV